MAWGVIRFAAPRLMQFTLLASTVLVHPATARMTSWLVFPAIRLLELQCIAIVVYFYNVATGLGELRTTVVRVQVRIRTCMYEYVLALVLHDQRTSTSTCTDKRRVQILIA